MVIVSFEIIFHWVISISINLLFLKSVTKSGFFYQPSTLDELIKVIHFVHPLAVDTTKSRSFFKYTLFLFYQKAPLHLLL